MLYTTLLIELWLFADELLSSRFDKSVAGYVTDPLNARYQEHTHALDVKIALTKEIAANRVHRPLVTVIPMDR